jgi:hypothetical protein
MKRRVRMLIHWDLVTTVVALAFLSGGLASRGSVFLESWTAKDNDFVLRMALLGAGLACGAGAVALFFKDFASAGRSAAQGLLIVLLAATALTAGAWIDRSYGTGASAMAGSVRALLGSVAKPLNLLALGAAALFAAIQISFEREPGNHRVLISRLLMTAGFPAFYVFGIGLAGFDQPFRNLMLLPELSIPLATGSALACFFGALLVTGYNFEMPAKSFGTALAIAGAVGLYAFAVLMSQPTSQDRWTALLSAPFSDVSKRIRDTGTLMAVVLVLASMLRATLFAGLRRQERVYRKKF